MREDKTSIRVRKVTQELLNKAKGKLEYDSGQLYTLDTALQQVLKEWLDIKPPLTQYVPFSECEHNYLVRYHDNALLCKECNDIVWQGKRPIETPPKNLLDKVVG